MSTPSDFEYGHQHLVGIPIHNRLRFQELFLLRGWKTLWSSPHLSVVVPLIISIVSVGYFARLFFLPEIFDTNRNPTMRIDPLEVPIINNVDWGLTPHDWEVRWLSKDLKWSEDAILEEKMDFLNANCDFFSFHTATPTYLKDMGKKLTLLLKAEAEWLSYQFLPEDETSRMGTCLLILSNRTELPRFHELLAMDENETRASLITEKWKSRFHAGLVLDQVARYRVDHGYNSYLGGKYPLFGNYHDFDIFYSNKSRTYEALLDRIDRGVKMFHNGGDTTETRLCREWHKTINDRHSPMDWDWGRKDTEKRIERQARLPPNRMEPLLPPEFPCDWERIERMRRSLRSVADIAVISAFDNKPDTGWELNGGVTIYQLGTPTAKFVLEAVLSIINTERIRHAYDRSDQGKLTFVLNHSAAINFDTLPYIVKWGNNEYSFLGPSTDGDEIIILGMMDVELAKSIPHFKYAAEHWERDRPTMRDAMGVAIVSPKWMNSPACPDSIRRLNWQLRTFRCGDMAGHFNGCAKENYESYWLRKKIYLECSNSDDFPAKTNADGSPFTWEKFLNDSRGKNDTEIKMLLTGLSRLT